jgi:hypothetical protein
MGASKKFLKGAIAMKIKTAFAYVAVPAFLVADLFAQSHLPMIYYMGF